MTKHKLSNASYDYFVQALLRTKINEFQKKLETETETLNIMSEPSLPNKGTDDRHGLANPALVPVGETQKQR